MKKSLLLSALASTLLLSSCGPWVDGGHGHGRRYEQVPSYYYYYGSDGYGAAVGTPPPPPPPHKAKKHKKPKKHKKHHHHDDAVPDRRD